MTRPPTHPVSSNAWRRVSPIRLFSTMPVRLPVFPLGARCSTTLLCLLFIPALGCVAESTYQAVQTDIEESRASLAAMKTELSQLTFEAEKLQELNQQQNEVLADRLARLKVEQDEEAAWHKQIVDRTDALTRKLNALQSQRRWMTRGIEEAIAQQGELERLVADYKSKLEDTRVLPESVITTMSRPSDQASGGNEPSLSGPASSVPPSTIAPSTPSSPPPDPTPVRPTKPKEESWLSSLKGWLGSIWSRIFS